MPVGSMGAGIVQRAFDTGSTESGPAYLAILIYNEIFNKTNQKQNHFAQNYSAFRAILGTGILLFFKNKNNKIYCKIIGRRAKIAPFLRFLEGLLTNISIYSTLYFK